MNNLFNCKVVTIRIDEQSYEIQNWLISVRKYVFIANIKKNVYMHVYTYNTTLALHNTIYM